MVPVPEVFFSNGGTGHARLFVQQGVADATWSAYISPGSPGVGSISLADTWGNAAAGGVYVYCRQAPADPAAFVGTITAFAASCGTGWCNLFCWVHLQDEARFSLADIDLIKIKMNSLGQYLLSNTNIKFGGMIFLSMTNDCAISLDKAFQQFVIIPNGGCFSFSNNSTPGAYILNQVIYLPYAPAYVGTLRFSLQMNGANDAAGYQVGLRYFYPAVTAQGFTSIFSAFVDSGYTSVMTFQVALDPINQLPGDAGQMPRTFLAFASAAQIIDSCLRLRTGKKLKVAPNTAWQAKSASFPYDLPVADGTASLLAFSQQKADKDNPRGARLHFYLAPSGDFFLILDPVTDADPTPQQMLMGLSGIETIAFIPRGKTYAGDILSFALGMGAHAAAFPIAGGASDTHSLLDATFVTAWMALKESPQRPQPPSGADYAIRYLAQPKGSPLYYAADDPALLSFFQPLTNYLTHGTAPIYFPSLLYAGISLAAQTPAQVQDYEFQIIGPWRKKTIETATMPLEARRQQKKLTHDEHALAQASGAGSPTDAGVVKSTTPQGLYAEIDTASSAWNVLTLSKNEFTPGAGDAIAMQFTDLGATLKSAFQTNQQFLVISLNALDPFNGHQPVLGALQPASGKGGAAASAVFENEMTIEGWPFKIDVPMQALRGGDYANVLIFKYCKGTLLERVQNTKLWVNAAGFNDGDSLDALSTWIAQYVQDGIDQWEKNKDQNYFNFHKKVTDTEWTGILALKTSISLQDFPEALKGLLAGIDLTRFNAHHFGINANHVAPDPATGELTMDNKSSLFGLIDYVDELFEQFPDNLDMYKITVAKSNLENYYFKTLTLKVLFENSKIQNFQSLAQLTINNLFGSPINLVSNENILILTGHYEDHGGTPIYSFSETGDNFLKLQNGTLSGVEIIKASFTTQNKGQSEDTHIRTRFSLWGYMNFAVVAGIDLLSFGSKVVDQKPVVRSGDGLCYSNLGITMDFDIDAQTNNISNQVFAFDPSAVAFDLSQSTPRKDSLYPHFPIQLRSLVGGDDNNSPSSQGFLGISVPDYTGDGASGPWCGLVFDLSMGTLGNLVGKAFSTSLLISWDAGAAQAVSVYLQLPGVNTKSKFISLQGVLKLDIGSITLQKGAVQGYPDQVAYLMLIKKIALQFLGVQLPPSAEIDFYLFGDPAPGAAPSSAGWYAAYQKAAPTNLLDARR